MTVAQCPACGEDLIPGVDGCVHCTARGVVSAVVPMPPEVLIGYIFAIRECRTPGACAALLLEIAETWLGDPAFPRLMTLCAMRANRVERAG